jgi:hypothetical protein
LWRTAIGALAVGATAYFVVTFATQIALFAGCVEKEPDGRYRPLGAIGCLAQPALVYERLDMLARPRLALATHAAALARAGAAAWRLGQERRIAPAMRVTTAAG